MNELEKELSSIAAIVALALIIGAVFSMVLVGNSTIIEECNATDEMGRLKYPN